MRVADFEQAIDSKGARIIELRIHHGHVRQAIGRKDEKMLIWDDQGKAHSSFLPKDMDDEEAMQQMRQFIFDKDPGYDLDF